MFLIENNCYFIKTFVFMYSGVHTINHLATGKISDFSCLDYITGTVFLGIYGSMMICSALEYNLAPYLKKRGR